MFMTLADGAYAFGSIIALVFFFSFIIDAAAAVLPSEYCVSTRTKWKCIIMTIYARFAKTCNLNGIRCVNSVCMGMCTQKICRNSVLFIWFSGASFFLSHSLLLISYFVELFFFLSSVVSFDLFLISCCLFVISVRYFSSWINACNNITSEYLFGHLIIILFYFSLFKFFSLQNCRCCCCCCGCSVVQHHFVYGICASETNDRR